MRLLSILVLTLLSAAPSRAQRPEGFPSWIPPQQAAYIENKGQWDSRVDFRLTLDGLDMWITERGVTYDVWRLSSSDTAPTDVRRRGQVVRVTFEGAQVAHPRGGGWLDAESNFFRGDDPTRYARHARSYSLARLDSLYDGIAAFFTVDHAIDRPMYGFDLDPGADPSQIRMRIDGADSVSIAPDGTLRAWTEFGPLEHAQLKALAQPDRNTGVVVPCAFRLNSDGTVGFALGRYDRNARLVIDPLIYSSYIGSGSNEVPGGIARDRNGVLYVTGTTYARDFPTTSGAYDVSANGDADVFVIRMTGDRHDIAYSTYLGGSGDDRAAGIAIDATGNIYVAGGTSSSDFPTTQGAFDRTYNGSGDVFATRIDARGDILGYSTYIGGPGSETCHGLAIDRSANLFLAGEVSAESAAGFPTTRSAFDATHNGGVDAFVARLNPAGSLLDFATFLGGSGQDRATDIVLDDNGSVYVTGATSSTNFPIMSVAGEPQHGGLDAFVARLNTTGTTLTYSTFLGGSADDIGEKIAVDRSGYMYVTGETNSVGAGGTPFPTTPRAYLSILPGRGDLFATKISATSATLLFSTIYGGVGSDAVNGLAVDALGAMVITGETYSDDLPTTPTAYDRVYRGAGDAFVTRFAVEGDSLMYSTFLGRSGLDAGNAIALDPYGNAIILGTTTSSGFPTSLDAYDKTYNGGSDLFLTILSLSDLLAPVPDVAQLPALTGECSVTVTTFPTATDNKAGSVTATTTDPLVYTRQGTYTIRWRYDDGNGNVATQTQRVTVDDTTAPTPDVASLPAIVSECSASIAGRPTATDNCAGKLTGVTTDPLSFARQGLYTVRWKYDDGNGNVTTQDQRVLVADTTLPTIAVQLEPDTLRLNDHSMVSIAATIAAADNCDGWSVVLDSIGSSEADQDLGGGDLPLDIQGAFRGTDDRSFDLRAELAPGAAERVYTVKYTITDAGSNTVAGIAHVYVERTSGLEEGRGDVTSLGARAEPNPARDGVSITFGLANAAHVRLRISDARGVLIATLADRPMLAGRHELRWTARNADDTPIQAGTYFFTVEAGGVSESGKILLVR